MMQHSSQAMEEPESASTVTRYVLTTGTLHRLNNYGYLSCNKCGRRFVVGMEVVCKKRLRSSKYCGLCADILGLE